MLPVVADFVRNSMAMHCIEDGYRLLWAVENGHLREGGSKVLGTGDEDIGECRRTFCVKDQEGHTRQLKATSEAGQLPPPGL